MDGFEIDEGLDPDTLLQVHLVHMATWETALQHPIYMVIRWLNNGYFWI